MSRSKRVWQVLATMLVVSLIAAGCGDDDDDSSASGGGSGDGEGSIWVLLPDTASSDRWEKDDRRFFAEAFEEAGLSEGDDFTIVNAEGDAATQQSQAEHHQRGEAPPRALAYGHREFPLGLPLRGTVRRQPRTERERCGAGVNET